MEFATVEDAMTRSGMRLVVAAGTWALWCEFTKNIFHVKDIPFTAVAHKGFAENPELVAWTGVRNQPQAIYNDEPVRTGWLDILNMAERIAPEPRLLPKSSVERADVIGWANEICGEGGIGWCRRIQIAAQFSFGDEGMKRMRDQYGLSDGAAASAEQRTADIISNLAARMQGQKRLGRRYLLGNVLSAIDIYWACVSNLVSPLPFDVCPMDESTRAAFANPGEIIARALDPILIEHRDFIYRNHLIYPVTFE
jgi:glutathione S-transferase